MSAEEKGPRLRAVAMHTEEEDTPLSAAELDANDGRSSLLNALVNEARLELEPGPRDWSRVEARLLQELPVQRPGRARQAVARGVIVALAVAAGVGLFVRHRASEAPAALAVAPAPAPAAPRVASALRGTEGTGEVTVNGARASAGTELHANDTIGAEGARALFDRPGKVAWLLEPNAAKAGGRAAARVTSSGEPLVLALEDGAVEAQVTPVPVGEAFAVDLTTPGHDRLRVAVHGTHLRVMRAGNRVVVDLTEGVVAIGVAPAEGITTGADIHAPAHIELDATDLASLKVTSTGLFAPIPLGGHVPAVDPAALLPAETAPLAAPSIVAAAPVRPVPPVTPARAPRPALATREAIAAAVRDCAAAAPRERASEVRVTVSSALRLTVDDAGAVTAAQFTPPLLPEIQTCAATAIYRARLAEHGELAIPIEFSF